MSLSLSPSDDDRKGHHAAPGELATSGAPGQVRVLVVEDEWLVSMEIETILENAGFQVVGVAVSADEAVRMAETERPDLVMMDIRLKGRGDGVDAALEINRRLGLRCLFVSAYTDDRMRERAQAARPLGWLSKPFSDRQLLKTLQAALRGLKH